MQRRSFLGGLLGAACSAVVRFSPLAVVDRLTADSRPLTLVEAAKRLDLDGRVDAIVEIMAAHNKLLMDMPFVPVDGVKVQKCVVRVRLPDTSWRQL